MRSSARPCRSRVHAAELREQDLQLFLDLAGEPPPADARPDVALRILVPAFMISRAEDAPSRSASCCSCPFLIIDMVVASVLMSMGMMMLPPASSRCRSS